MGQGLPLRPEGLGAGLPLLLALALGGCSNTPLGQQLGNSFGPAPESAPGTAAKPLEKQKPAEQPKPTPEAKPAGQQKPGQQKQVEQPKTVLEPKPMAETKPVTPVPYRVVLRLPMADPSAPAEALTRALRAANLPFEVETIERVNPAAPATSPVPVPAHGR
jgi:hypothetical protein